MLALPLILCAGLAYSHGDAVPQAVNTAGLPELPEVGVENPWREAEDDVRIKAFEIGAKGYNSNCARCHGLEGISGGLAPDLRFLEATDFGDEWYLDRVMNGYEQNGAVKMPPFGDIFTPQAVWAIRVYIETLPDADEVSDRESELAAFQEKVKGVTEGTDPAEVSALVEELNTAGDSFAALSGGEQSVTVLHRAAHLIEVNPARGSAAADLIAAEIAK
ncbi:cytochrome c-550 PedF [Paracoccus caeni]|uniref:Cytochrome c-550 PedF n=1 Tax=Paracoccus caeni TaxID=657651 RepID=A0A934SNQ4_9RHOB|nr:cytochrome c-550 PedF [Paracoccus caeni]MBK4217663.1 cytochrome c-550 PedF [Paracoccus caeni]